MKTYVVGDIHGHLVALKALLDAAPMSADDLLIFLGDYVDKGPDTKGVLESMTHLANRPNTVFLRGNHDQMLLDAHFDPLKFPMWDCLAGSEPLASYGPGPVEILLGCVPEHHWDFLRHACVDHFENEGFIFVHGGIRPDRQPAEEDLEHLHWLTLSMAMPHQSQRTVVCGHSAQASGRIADLGHTICVDTGIAMDGYLTCLELSCFDYWQSSSGGVIRSGRLR